MLTWLDGVDKLFQWLLTQLHRSVNFHDKKVQNGLVTIVKCFHPAQVKLGV